MVKDPSEFWENPNVTSKINTILQDKQKEFTCKGRLHTILYLLISQLSLSTTIMHKDLDCQKYDNR